MGLTRKHPDWLERMKNQIDAAVAGGAVWQRHREGYCGSCMHPEHETCGTAAGCPCCEQTMAAQAARERHEREIIADPFPELRGEEWTPYRAVTAAEARTEARRIWGGDAPG